MDPNQRLDVVRALEGHGLFQIKGSVDELAKRLGVSRFTVYGYVEAVREAEKATGTQRRPTWAFNPNEGAVGKDPVPQELEDRARQLLYTMSPTLTFLQTPDCSHAAQKLQVHRQTLY